jgi:hypothetical protein
MQHVAHAVLHQMNRNLAQVDRWIDKTEAAAAARKYDPNHLLQVRLAPDMFPLVRQLGSACDTAKLCTARLTGRTPKSHADNETTWAEVRARVADVVAFVSEVTPESLADLESRTVRFPWAPGVSLSGGDYFLRHAVPNFYFHLSMSYAILRSNGVDLGKGDYLGDLPWHRDEA